MSSSEDTLAGVAPASNVWVQPAKRVPETAESSPLLASDARTRKRPGPADEKHYRSLLKAVSWRATGTLDTIFISFLVTGHIKLAVSIGFVELFTKIGLFYVHERIWSRIPLGRAQPPEDYTI